MSDPLPTEPRIGANLIINGLLPELKRAKLTISQSPVSPEDMAMLVLGISGGVINFSDAKKLIRQRFV
jgi:Asp-tRNA(Asn)/Glu-tRNA(Gln) amidotransferase B subunit